MTQVFTVKEDVIDKLQEMGYQEVKVPTILHGAKQAFRGGNFNTRHYVGVNSNGSWFLRFSSVPPRNENGFFPELAGNTAAELNQLEPLLD